jgi:antitoxin component of MazEF toxin-antitoxin module
MKTTVSKWGNSMALRIPKSVLEENMLHEGSQVEIISKDGKIILEPQEKKVREGWEQAAKEVHKSNDDKLMMDISNEFDREEWTW